MKIIDNQWLCELDNCVYNYVCKDCKHCIDGLYYDELEAEAMLKEEPYYLDGDGNLKKVKL